ncbi:hypothetical protein [Leptolyngbya sp. NIES-2104]|uniref:hypothetical protein n=1 Tax=Leptolyngbya sp. NIES-2104 TaxID=1552121 RepID=UPI0006EC7B83|nr:hypothetical protein [Leptolyngbya sp. NIES-2104]GAP97577.1 hypothetical protein NIES2104_41240 [Leptolyngbya sp. NIES-2104]
MRVLSVSIGFLTLASSFAFVAAPKAIAQNTTPYPAEAVQIFTDTCVSQGDPSRVPTAIMREICSCNIREIQKTYTFEEFVRIGTTLGEGKEPPAGFKEIVEGCVVEVLKK